MSEDEMDVREFLREFEIEARRLSLNMLRLPNLSASGSNWKAPLLDRMRGLAPGATWEDVFPGIELPDPDPDLADLVEAADGDPEAYWRDHELATALWNEIERVAPLLPDAMSANADGVGYTIPGDRELALQVLRRLPDGAGWDAFLKALEHTPRSTAPATKTDAASD